MYLYVSILQIGINSENIILLEKLFSTFPPSLKHSQPCYRISICETSVFQPYPGSEAFESPGEHDVVIDSFHWSNYRENPPFFPPVSHLGEFSPFEITQWYWTFRLHVLQWLTRALGYTFEDLNEL